jgi:hypothetical protein
MPTISHDPTQQTLALITRDFLLVDEHAWHDKEIIAQFYRRFSVPLPAGPKHASRLGSSDEVSSMMPETSHRRVLTMIHAELRMLLPAR